MVVRLELEVPRPVLTAMFRRSGVNAALKDGLVHLEQVELRFEEVPVLVQGFRRMVRELAYDVSEMALTTYLCAREHGVRFTALPIFLVRGFHHGALWTRRVGGESPAGLEGRSVGVNRGYTVTTGVWARAILAEEHGVDLDLVTWVPTGDEHVASYQLPPNVTPAPVGLDLSAATLRGDLSASIGIRGEDSELRPLLEDPETAAREAMRQRGLYPINHLVVVRDDVLEQHPDLAVDLMDAFGRAKDLYLERLPNSSDPDDRTYRIAADVLGGDPLPYGLEANADVLESLVRHAVDQRILSTAPDLEDVFATSTLDITR